MISGTSGIITAMYGQLQEQSLRRTADQAQAQANALQQRAASARRDANQARENARELEVESAQAQGKAENARRGVAMLDQVGQDDHLSVLIANLSKVNIERAESLTDLFVVIPVPSIRISSIGSFIDVTA